MNARFNCPLRVFFFVLMLSFLLYPKHFQSFSEVENYTMNPLLSPYSNMELLPHLFHVSFLYSSTFSWLKYLKENSRHIIPDIWAFSDVTTPLSQATNEQPGARVGMPCPDPLPGGGLVVPAAGVLPADSPGPPLWGLPRLHGDTSPRVCGLSRGSLQPTTDPCQALRLGQLSGPP